MTCAIESPSLWRTGGQHFHSRKNPAMQIEARFCSVFVPGPAGANVPSFRCLARGTKERAACRAISPETASVQSAWRSVSSFHA